MKEGGIHLIWCLALSSLLAAAISVGPVPPILYFTDQVWAGAVLGCFVKALGSVQGTCIILRALWGLMKVVAG